jgi:glycosidase/sugar/nucleoside kinase (ribokinase family)
MPSWVPDAIFYAVLPDRLEPPRPEELAPYAREAFEPWDAPPAHRAYKGGNLHGVARHLDRLVDLGVTALLLTPITVSPSYHRYKPIDLLHVDPLLGGDAAFDTLLDAAHRRGLRVVGDLVVNHVGVGARPFADLVELGQRSPYRSWFHVSRFPVRPHDAGAPGYRGWNGNPSMPVLDHRDPAARAYVVAAAEHWARSGLDGLRLDAAGEVEAPELFDELTAVVKRVNADFYVVGETWSDASTGLDGKKWDGATNYPLCFAIREFIGGARLDLAHAHPDSMRAGGIDAAEYARRVAELLARHTPAHTRRQLNFVDGHDVARLSTLTGGDASSVALAALLLFTFPGAPCIYYGAEVGLEGGMPPDCRRGFPAAARWRPEVLALHRRLITLRRAYPALRGGAYEPLVAIERTLAFLRRDDGATLLVAVNAGDAPARLVLDVPGAPRLLEGDAGVAVEDGRLAITLAARAGAVLELGGAARAAGPTRPVGLDVVVVGNIGIDTNVYLPGSARTGVLESAFTDDVDTIGQAGGYSAFGHAALGRRTGFIGHVGDDALGRWIDDELAAAGVARLLGTDPAGTMRSVNLMAQDGTRKNFYDGKSHMVLQPDLARCRHFLGGARLAMFHLPNWARQLLPVARELGATVATDLQDMTSADDPYRLDFILASDFLFCSAVNLEPAALSAALRAKNPRATVVLGLGARGAALHDAAGYRAFPPVSLELPVIDTNGAGDSLAAGFLSAHVLDGRPVDEAMRWGQLAARWACTRRAKWRHLITRAQLEAVF